MIVATPPIINITPSSVATANVVMTVRCGKIIAAVPHIASSAPSRVNHHQCAQMHQLMPGQPRNVRQSAHTGRRSVKILAHDDSPF